MRERSPSEIGVFHGPVVALGLVGYITPITPTPHPEGIGLGVGSPLVVTLRGMAGRQSTTAQNVPISRFHGGGETIQSYMEVLRVLSIIIMVRYIKA